MAEYVVIKECENRPKKKHPKRRRWLKVIIILSIIIGLGCWYYFGRIAPVIFTIIDIKTTQNLTKAVGDSTTDALVGYSYDDYIILRTDTSGNITYLGVNSVTVNLFTRRVTALVRERMDKIEQTGIEIPFGVFTGIPFFSNLGAGVTLSATTLTVANAFFSSSFEDAGINQTLHKIFITVECAGEVVLPGYTNSINNSTQIMVCESVIVGKIPNTYLDFGAKQ